MGFEGTNVIFDTWVHPLIMGLEEHLLTMFRDDFEFNDDAVPSHLGGEGGGAQQTDKVTPMAPCRAGRGGVGCLSREGAQKDSLLCSR